MDTTLHQFLDFDYGPDGDDRLILKLENGADPNQVLGPARETPLHVATRRRRLHAVQTLLDHGADINARNRGGKTAYVHALRRGFYEIASYLKKLGADTTLSPADALAVAVSRKELTKAKNLLDQHPGIANTGNPEEDRLLADVAGRGDTEPVRFLIKAGADLAAPGLDDGTPLHIAAWFGQPENARLLLQAGAPLDVFDGVHESSPLGWAVHGSRYSGGAKERQDAYVTIVKMLLEAGASMEYPDAREGRTYAERLLEDASPPVRSILELAGSR